MRNNVLLYSFNFLKSLHFFGALAVPFYLVRLEFSYTQMFMLEMIFSVCVFLAEVPTGVVADKFGRKTSLFLGALIFGLSFVLIGKTLSLPLLVVAQVAGAIGNSLISGADKALVYENAKLNGKTNDETVAIASRYDAFGTAGSLAAFPLGSIFVASGIVPYTNALGLVFVATGICIMVAAFLVLPVAEKTQEVNGNGRYNSLGTLRHAAEGCAFVFKNPQLRRFSLNYSVISALTFLMFWFYQSLLLENGVDVGWNGFVAAGFNLGATLLLLASGIIQRKFGTNRTLFLSSLIPGILYISLFGFYNSLPVVFVAIFGITMLRLFRSPLLETLMNNQIQDANRATVLSGVSMMQRILVAAFYPLAGLLMDVSSRWTYLIIGIATVAASFMLSPNKAGEREVS